MLVSTDYLSKPIVLEHLTQLLQKYFANKMVHASESIPEARDENVQAEVSREETAKQNEMTSDTTYAEEEQPKVDISPSQSEDVISKPAAEAEEEVSVPEKSEEEPASKEVTIEADILLHHQEPLSSKGYATLLKNLGYTVDVADTTIAFMDRVESKHYPLCAL